MRKDRRYGGIEAGGTKFLCAVGSGAGAIYASKRIATTTPDETLGRAIAFLRAHAPLAAIGIGSFGPAGVRPGAPDWGHIGKTPKPGWRGTDMAGVFARAFGCPIGFDTDVDAAVLAEAASGAAQGCKAAVYLTIGTGIGGGAVIDGAVLHGRSHPEMGHILLARHPDDSAFAGVCPFHGDCAEGLASGPAISARWGMPLDRLPADHPAHAIIAYYLGQLCIAVMAILSPQRIILGGGVMAADALIDHVRTAAARQAGGFFGDDPGAIIVPPGHGDRSGIVGALLLAERAEQPAGER